MNALANMYLARALQEDRLRKAAQRRRVAAARRPGSADGELVIRQASCRDARRIERLAQLDSGPTPAGPTLVAELDGHLVAAVPVSGDGAVADPFVASAPLVELLKLRAAQLQIAR